MKGASILPRVPIMRGVTIALAAVLSACGPSDGPPTAPAATAGPGGVAYAKAPSSINLTITMLDADATGAPYQIRSDGGGPYVNGAQGLQVQLDGWGSIQFSPNNASTTTPAARTLVFDYTSPLDPANRYRPVDTPTLNFKIKNRNVAIRIQDLGINGNPATSCFYVDVTHRTAALGLYDYFGPVDYPQSGYVTISRTNPAGSPATWTAVSDGACQANPSVAYLQTTDLTSKRGVTLEAGYYHQRFAMTMQQIP